jgi:hypothetical protein
MSESGAEYSNQQRGVLWGLGVFTLAAVIALWVVSWYWSLEPKEFDVQKEALESAKKTDMSQLPIGFVYSNTLKYIANEILYKPGGYLTNDVAPPGVLMDNMPSWEFGALVMLRDATTALRNHFSRAQSQSSEDPDLMKAEPYFYYEPNSWALPSTESEYQKGIDSLLSYNNRLSGKGQSKGMFYARADNLRQYLELVEKRLGDYSTRLSASSDRHQNLIMPVRSKELVGISTISRTPWLEIDNIFYEVRGATWALLHILKAIEYEFNDVLIDKHALDTMKRMINELENGLAPVLSPLILNGNGFGVTANYSLTLANYITRANAAALDLRDIMMRG